MSKTYAGVEDLLCDESFLSWYFKTDPRAMRHWDQWLAANPGSLGRIEQAVEFLQSVRLGDIELGPDQMTQAESVLLEKVRQAETRQGKSRPILDQATLDSVHGSLVPDDGSGDFERPVPVPDFSAANSKRTVPMPRRWWMAAASVILLAAGLFGAYRWRTHGPELRTAYGEIRENKLPDGTEVVVNADSKLVYSTGWQDGKDREVWLTGEAFFHVARTPLKSRFVVHTDHFDIIVTGTRFNVVNRQGKTNIMLKEGSVILHTGEGKEWKMVPGDFVEYRDDRLEKKCVKNDSILAWKEHKLIFDNTPVRELANIIREHYGITVQLADDSIGSKTISGILPNDNLEVLLQALEATTDFEVLREKGDILIRRHS